MSTDQSPTKLVQPGTSRLFGDSVKIKMGLFSIDTDDIRPVLYQVKRVMFHPVHTFSTISRNADDTCRVHLGTSAANILQVYM